MVQEFRHDRVVPDGAGRHRREAVAEVVRPHRRGPSKGVGEIGPFRAKGRDGPIAGGRERLVERRPRERLAPAVGRVERLERLEPRTDNGFLRAVVPSLSCVWRRIAGGVECQSMSDRVRRLNWAG
jgi:hypothetical protein